MQFMERQIIKKNLMYQLKNKILGIFLLIIAIFFSSTEVFSAVQSPKRYLQLINSATESTEFFSLGRINPAIATLDSSFQVLAEAFPNKFGINELNPASISILTPLIDKSFQFRFGVCGIFNSIFDEYSFNTGISVKLLEDMRLGAELEYSKFQITRSNEFAALSLNIGTLIALHNKVNLGIAAQFCNEYENSDIKLDKLNIGLGINELDNICADCGFRIGIGEASNFYVQSKLLISDLLSCRLGYMTNPNSLQAGILLSLNSMFAFSINLEKSEYLPFSSFIQLGLKL